jgi:hypothetical protein
MKPFEIVFKHEINAMTYLQQLRVHWFECGSTLSEIGEVSCIRCYDMNYDLTHKLIIDETLHLDAHYKGD